MASDDKKAKATPTPKKETPAAGKSIADAAKAPDAAPAKAPDAAPAKAADAVAAKPEGGEAAAAAPAGYSRGEGQKPVTQAYKDNWNAIFAKKPTNKKKR